MANFLDKIKVNTAVKDHVKLDLSCDHISTANFMQFNVAWSKEMVPGEKISVNMETFTRLQPMPVPTFGRARINNRAFFVPFRTIFPGWNDFITDTKHSFANGTSAIINYAPRISNNSLFIFLFNSSANVETVTDGSAYDYEINDGSETKFVKMKEDGRRYIKILQSLGYVIPTEKLEEDVYFSALPLLAVGKVYYDWYYPSAYTDSVEAVNLSAMFNEDTTTDLTLGPMAISNILTVIKTVCYDSDYFVSAWQNPTAPNDGSYSGFSIPDITLGTTNNNAVLNNNPEGTPNIRTGVTGNISQYMLQGLRSLTDYMKRHQLVGARALDRYMTRFGIQLSAEKLKRSIYIGTTSDDIQFGDVTSTSDTTGAALGDYAGKGLGYGKSNFDFETDEYGIMIIVSSILPKAGYFQGLDRNVMHTTKLDYWTPEFDNLGTQAISKAELFVPTRTGILNGTMKDLTDGVFGWTPRYAEYKVGRDRVTGDFRMNSMNVDLGAWHTMRELDYSALDAMVVNKNFTEGIDAEQYNRIFYGTNDSSLADKFTVIYHFDVASYSPMKALFDTYDFEEKGKEVTMNANGVKMN